MGSAPTPSSPHQLYYSPQLEARLYQSFIFSIPIFFSIILFLLFYIFYVKRSTSSPSLTLPMSSNQLPPVDDPSGENLKGVFKDKLPVVTWNEESMKNDSMCCICLGEFEMKQQLHKLPSCKHIFHSDCICHWLSSNSTCPLCRCSVVMNSAENSPSEPTTSFIQPIVRMENGRLNNQVFCAEQQNLCLVNLNIVCTRESPAEGSAGTSSSINIGSSID